VNRFRQLVFRQLSHLFFGRLCLRGAQHLRGIAVFPGFAEFAGLLDLLDLLVV